MKKYIAENKYLNTLKLKEHFGWVTVGIDWCTVTQIEYRLYPAYTKPNISRQDKSTKKTEMDPKFALFVLTFPKKSCGKAAVPKKIFFYLSYFCIRYNRSQGYFFQKCKQVRNRTHPTVQNSFNVHAPHAIFETIIMAVCVAKNALLKSKRKHSFLHGKI
jgi:hypothetical protein